MLDLGAHTGQFARLAPTDPRSADRVGLIISTDVSARMVGRAPRHALVADEERLPFASGAFDLAVSALSLHSANDLPGVLIQLRQALRPDGLMLVSVLGGRTLHELRGALLDAELELTGGVSARVSPFADTFDMAGLLQRAGFALPVADIDRHTVRYGSPWKLLEDLRGMGETSVLAGPRRPLSPRMLARAMELYTERHAGPDGRVSATFEVITASGWVPHASQQKPLRPGAARARLAEALSAQELSAGEKAG